MRRVTKDWIVVDHENNSVGFLKADNLALVDIKRFEDVGFLTGAMGLEYGGKQYIYLWFSSGTLILLDGLNLT